MANYTVTTLVDETFDGGETVASPDGTGLSLREALALANGNGAAPDTIDFDPGLAGGTLFLQGGELAITTDGITVDGDTDGDNAADITISADSANGADDAASRVFSIGAPSAISAALNGLTIQDGNSAGLGGGIYVGTSDELTLSNATVSGNAAYNGGGIGGNLYSTIALENSTVSNNTAGNDGGGIYGFVVTLTNATVSDNRADIAGGGIHQYGFRGDLVLNGSTVSGNHAGARNYVPPEGITPGYYALVYTGDGGGIYSSGYYATLTLNGSVVAGNSVYYRGGGITFYGRSMTMTGSTVSDNRAGFSSYTDDRDIEHFTGVRGAGGGIVAAGDAEVTLTDSTVSNNYGFYNAGGIFGLFGTTLTLTNTTVSDNSTEGDGGGILGDTDVAITATGSSITGNTGDAYGGGISADNDVTVTLTGSTISGNTVGFIGGGVAAVSDSTVTLTDSIVSGNVSEFDGGGILSRDSTLALTNSTVSNNTASGKGGGVLADESTIALTNTTVSGNSARLDGGGIYNEGSTATLTNVTLSANVAGIDGGGLYNRGGTTTLTNATVSGNFASGYYIAVRDSRGGGIYSGGDLTLANTVVAGNNAVTAGPDIYGAGPTVYSGVNLFSQPGAGDAEDIIETTLTDIFASVVEIDPDGAPGSGDEFDAGELADNGGPVDTIALLAEDANPAVDSGDPDALNEAAAGIDLNGDGDTGDVIDTDARGFPRDVDFDGGGGTPDLGAFEVQPPNDPPVARDDAFTTDELTAINGAASVLADNGGGVDDDPDGDPLTVTRINGAVFTAGAAFALASGALLTMNADGTFTWDPNGLFEALPAPGSGASNLTAQDTFTYAIDDGSGVTDTATVTVTVTGVDNNDRLFGAAGVDDLDGGVANDDIIASAGDDMMEGGPGNDTANYSAATQAVTVDLDAGQALGAETGSDTLSNVENAIGGAGNDSLTGDGGGNALDGQGGDDTLLGDAGIDSLYGGPGDDDLDGGPGADFMLGGPGDDTYRVDDPLDLVDEGGAFAAFAGLAGDFDTILSTAEWFWDVYSAAERMAIEAGAAGSGPGEDGTTIVGSTFDNEMVGNGTGTNVLFGRGGSDTYRGGDGIDHISLSLLGLTDENAYVGVDGVNTIIVEARTSGASSYDIVWEYEPGKDRLDVTDYGYPTAADIPAGIDDGLGNSYYALGDGFDYLVLVGVTAAQVSGDDFIV